MNTITTRPPAERCGRWGRRMLVMACCLASAACTSAVEPANAWRMPAMPRSAPASSGGGNVNGKLGPVSPGLGFGGESGARGDLPEGITLPPDTAFWVYRERAAFVAAERSGRGVMIDFYADWCVPCQLMDRDIFADPQTRVALVSKAVPLRVNVTEDSRSTRDQMMRFGVDHLPAILFLDAKGKEIKRVDQYLSADQFQAVVADLPDRRRHDVRGPAPVSVPTTQ